MTSDPVILAAAEAIVTEAPPPTPEAKAAVRAALGPSAAFARAS